MGQKDTGWHVSNWNQVNQVTGQHYINHYTTGPTLSCCSGNPDLCNLCRLTQSLFRTISLANPTTVHFDSWQHSRQRDLLLPPYGSWSFRVVMSGGEPWRPSAWKACILSQSNRPISWLVDCFFLSFHAAIGFDNCLVSNKQNRRDCVSIWHAVLLFFIALLKRGSVM